MKDIIINYLTILATDVLPFLIGVRLIIDAIRDFLFNNKGV